MTSSPLSPLNDPGDLPPESGFQWPIGTSITRLSYPSASPHRDNVTRRDRNVDLLSISYAFRPHLRTRLTLSGLTFLRELLRFLFRMAASTPTSWLSERIHFLSHLAYSEGT